MHGVEDNLKGKREMIITAGKSPDQSELESKIRFTGRCRWWNTCGMQRARKCQDLEKMQENILPG